MNYDEKSTKEKMLYDTGFEKARIEYTSKFGFGEKIYRNHTSDLINEHLNNKIKNKIILELGSQCWYSWVFLNGGRPSQINCINISQRELNKGISLYNEKSDKNPLNISFELMDAHNLQYRENSFDFVYGGAILHHLDFEKAMQEISRVLKEDGEIFFYEPLNINPVAKLIRKFTPGARTSTEKALTHKEFKILRKYFDIRFFGLQFFSVPIGMLFKDRINIFTRMFFKLDVFLPKIIPPIRYLYRDVIIIGKKR